MIITASVNVEKGYTPHIFYGWMDENDEFGLDDDYQEPLNVDKMTDLLNYISILCDCDIECSIMDGGPDRTCVCIDTYVDETGGYFDVEYVSFYIPNQDIYKFNRQSTHDNYSQISRDRYFNEGYNVAQFVCYPFACTHQYYDKMSEFKSLR